jgi:hypothetical protein
VGEAREPPVCGRNVVAGQDEATLVPCEVQCRLPGRVHTADNLDLLPAMPDLKML